MNLLRAVLLSIALVGPLYAADEPPVADVASAVITWVDGTPTPESVELGELICLDASTSIAGDAKESYQWHVTSPTRTLRPYTVNGGKTVVFAAGIKPTYITVFLSVAKDNSTSLTVTTINVIASDPEPEPPAPKPTPTPSTTKAEFTRITAKYNFNADQKAKIALAFRAASAKGIPSDPNVLIRSTSDHLAAKLGLNEVLRIIPWRDETLRYMYTVKPIDYGKFWGEVADVLEGK